MDGQIHLFSAIQFPPGSDKPSYMCFPLEGWTFALKERWAAKKKKRRQTGLEKKLRALVSSDCCDELHLKRFTVQLF